MLHRGVLTWKPSFQVLVAKDIIPAVDAEDRNFGIALDGGRLWISKVVYDMPNWRRQRAAIKLTIEVEPL